MELLDRLEHFEKHQLSVGDEYGAEVLHHVADLIESLRTVARAAYLVCRDLPSNEVEVAREAWGNTNTALVALRLADALLALDALPQWVLEENDE